MKACLIKCLSTYVPFLIFLIMIETRDDAGDNKSSFQRDESRESKHVRSSVSKQQEGHDRSQVPSSQCERDFLFLATLFCRSRDFVKSSAERARRWTRDAHRARGIAWALFMRQERGPRLDMELVDGSGKGVGEEERAGMEDGLFWEEDGLLAHDCEFRSPSLCAVEPSSLRILRNGIWDS